MWYSSLPGEPAFDVRFCRTVFALDVKLRVGSDLTQVSEPVAQRRPFHAVTQLAQDPSSLLW